MDRRMTERRWCFGSGRVARNGRWWAASAMALGLLACAEPVDRGPWVGTDGGEPSRIDATISFDASSTDAAFPPDASPPADAASPPDASLIADAGTGSGICLARGVACGASASPCCGELSCGTTTAGEVCCGGEGAACATPDGADCCGSTLLCVGGRCQPPGGPPPRFSAPYPCGERWTYDHHSAEVRQALDFVRSDGAVTDGSVQVASAPGVATRHVQAGGAGNYVVIDHGDGWVTYYFHLSEYLVAHGAWVNRGDPIGRTGSTGASSGPHIHYEQLRNGVGQVIHIEGASLAPYPGVYGVRHLVSENSCSSEGRHFSTWGSDRAVHQSPSTSSPVITRLAAPTRVLVDCQISGEEVSVEGFVNRWWAHLPEHGGYITNIYIDDPASYLPGVPECP